MDPEEIRNHLEPLYEAAMKEQGDINAGIDVLTKSAKEFISMQYSEEINHLSAAGYLELEDVINRYVTNLSIDIVNTFYHHSEE